MLILKFLQYLVFAYSLYFIGVALAGFFRARSPRWHPAAARFAVIVPAHNEEAVIGKLVRNLADLEYPRSLYDVYVVADNCIDGTARAARAAGATVWERHDRERRGKGFALEYALARLGFIGGREAGYDAAVIFDADNLVAPNFLQVMNDHLAGGETLVQCFIDSKNPDDGWVAAAFSLTFWLNNRFVLQARHNLGFSTALAGTGMCLSREVLREVGWSTVTLTEDLEFSIQALLKGHRTTFAPETRIYDEKPVSFLASCRQRLRWARGQVHTAFLYAPRLLWQGITGRSAVKVEAALRLLQLFMVVLGTVMAAALAAWPEVLQEVSPYYRLARAWPALGLFFPLFPYLLPLAALGLDRLPVRPFRYFPLYPVFALSCVAPILLALFTWRNHQWMPTRHTRALDHRHLVSGSTGRPQAGNF
jgi:cellulose synthase/poly-beta-1,6-N-acetylglucosamine synthase-like glycosyltransferase